MQNFKEIYLFGASGHGKVIAEILEANNIQIKGVFDANPALVNMLDYPVLRDNQLGELDKDASIIISIGNNATRKKVAEKIDVTFSSAIHPFAVISSRRVIGAGTVIMAGVVVNSDCTIGNHVILNTNASIDHDCIIGDYVHISPNAALAGNVTVGEGTHIGIGCSIIQGIKIGKWATLGAGAVIIRDVPDYAVVVGNPGRIIKYNAS